MEWINYHHLLYFWTVAREGSITKASKELLLAQPTISGQIHALEETLGEKLFVRSGRNLVLTEFGRMVYRYADEMFSLGRELVDFVKRRPVGRPVRLVVGVSDQLPKLVVYRILEPVRHLPEPVQLVIHEDKPERLLAELSLQSLDMVLSDSPIGPGIRIKAYNHLLGSCGSSFFAAPQVAEQYRRNFPECLNGAPMLMPLENSTLARSLEYWLESMKLKPNIVGQFQDSALMKVFGQAGAGIFPAPTVIEREVRKLYGVAPIGRTEAVQERFYIITVERKFKHPAVAAISEAAKLKLFRTDNGEE